MDTDALRMLADLGLERRDIVSAPDEIPKGRRVREDPREQADVAADFEARRLRNKLNGTGVEDERAARLKAWNTETTFETDEVTSQLENRWSGQGHRAGLNRQRLNRDDPWETIDARFGEERRLYLQETGAIQPNYAASPPARSGQDRFRDNVLGGNPPTPSSFSNGRRQNHSRGAPPPRAPAHARAPSPRRFGTVRFGPGGHRVEANGGGARTVANPGLQVAAAMRAAAAAQSIAAAHSSASPTNARAPKATSDDVTQVASPAFTAPDPQATAGVHVSPIAGGADPQPNPPTLNARTQKTSSGQRTTSVTRHSSSEWVEQARFNRAIWCAAHPDQCDEIVKKDPKILPYIGPARDELIKDAIGLASCDDEEEINKYLETHPERAWMVESGKKAKSQVEHDSDNQILEYCATNPRQMAFVRAAMAVFTPNRNAVVTRKNPAIVSTIATPPVPMETTSPELEKSSSEETTDSSGIGSGSSDTADSIQTGASTPPPRGIGTLIAAFFDAAGKFLGTHHAPANVPVYATVNVTSRAKHFDPRQLIGDIDVLAQSMVDRSHGLEGVRLTDDGLWVDDEL